MNCGRPCGRTSARPPAVVAAAENNNIRANTAPPRSDAAQPRGRAPLSCNGSSSPLPPPPVPAPPSPFLSSASGSSARVASSCFPSRVMVVVLSFLLLLLHLSADAGFKCDVFGPHPPMRLPGILSSSSGGGHPMPTTHCRSVSPASSSSMRDSRNCVPSSVRDFTPTRVSFLSSSRRLAPLRAPVWCGVLFAAAKEEETMRIAFDYALKSTDTASQWKPHQSLLQRQEWGMLAALLRYWVLLLGLHLSLRVGLLAMPSALRWGWRFTRALLFSHRNWRRVDQRTTAPRSLLVRFVGRLSGLLRLCWRRCCCPLCRGVVQRIGRRISASDDAASTPTQTSPHLEGGRRGSRRDNDPTPTDTAAPSALQHSAEIEEDVDVDAPHHHRGAVTARPTSPEEMAVASPPAATSHTEGDSIEDETPFQRCSSAHTHPSPEGAVVRSVTLRQDVVVPPLALPDSSANMRTGATPPLLGKASSGRVGEGGAAPASRWTPRSTWQGLRGDPDRTAALVPRSTARPSETAVVSPLSSLLHSSSAGEGSTRRSFSASALARRIVSPLPRLLRSPMAAQDVTAGPPEHPSASSIPCETLSERRARSSSTSATLRNLFVRRRGVSAGATASKGGPSPRPLSDASGLSPREARRLPQALDFDVLSSSSSSSRSCGVRWGFRLLCAALFLWRVLRVLLRLAYRDGLAVLLVFIAWQHTQPFFFPPVSTSSAALWHRCAADQHQRLLLRATDGGDRFSPHTTLLGAMAMAEGTPLTSSKPAPRDEGAAPPLSRHSSVMMSEPSFRAANAVDPEESRRKALSVRGLLSRGLSFGFTGYAAAPPSSSWWWRRVTPLYRWAEPLYHPCCRLDDAFCAFRRPHDVGSSTTSRWAEVFYPSDDEVEPPNVVSPIALHLTAMTTAAGDAGVPSGTSIDSAVPLSLGRQEGEKATCSSSSSIAVTRISSRVAHHWWDRFLSLWTTESRAISRLSLLRSRKSDSVNPLLVESRVDGGIAVPSTRVTSDDTSLHEGTVEDRAEHRKSDRTIASAPSAQRSVTDDGVVLDVANPHSLMTSVDDDPKAERLSPATDVSVTPEKEEEEEDDDGVVSRLPFIWRESWLQLHPQRHTTAVWPPPYQEEFDKWEWKDTSREAVPPPRHHHHQKAVTARTSSKGETRGGRGWWSVCREYVPCLLYFPLLGLDGMIALESSAASGPTVTAVLLLLGCSSFMIGWSAKSRLFVLAFLLVALPTIWAEVHEQVRLCEEVHHRSAHDENAFASPHQSAAPHVVAAVQRRASLGFPSVEERRRSRHNAKGTAADATSSTSRSIEEMTEARRHAQPPHYGSIATAFPSHWIITTWLPPRMRHVIARFQAEFYVTAYTCVCPTWKHWWRSPSRCAVGALLQFLRIPHILTPVPTTSLTMMASEAFEGGGRPHPDETLGRKSDAVLRRGVFPSRYYPFTVWSVEKDPYIVVRTPSPLQNSRTDTATRVREEEAPPPSPPPAARPPPAGKHTGYLDTWTPWRSPFPYAHIHYHHRGVFDATNAYSAAHARTRSREEKKGIQWVHEAYQYFYFVHPHVHFTMHSHTKQHLIEVNPPCREGHRHSEPWTNCPWFTSSLGFLWLASNASISNFSKQFLQRNEQRDRSHTSALSDTAAKPKAYNADSLSWRLDQNIWTPFDSRSRPECVSSSSRVDATPEGAEARTSAAQLLSLFFTRVTSPEEWEAAPECDAVPVHSRGQESQTPPTGSWEAEAAVVSPPASARPRVTHHYFVVEADQAHLTRVDGLEDDAPPPAASNPTNASKTSLLERVWAPPPSADHLYLLALPRSSRATKTRETIAKDMLVTTLSDSVWHCYVPPSPSLSSFLRKGNSKQKKDRTADGKDVRYPSSSAPRSEGAGALQAIRSELRQACVLFLDPLRSLLQLEGSVSMEFFTVWSFPNVLASTPENHGTSAESHSSHVEEVKASRTASWTTETWRVTVPLTRSSVCRPQSFCAAPPFSQWSCAALQDVVRVQLRQALEGSLHEDNEMDDDRLAKDCHARAAEREEEPVRFSIPDNTFSLLSQRQKQRRFLTQLLIQLPELIRCGDHPVQWRAALRHTTNTTNNIKKNTERSEVFEKDESGDDHLPEDPLQRREGAEWRTHYFTRRDVLSYLSTQRQRWRRTWEVVQLLLPQYHTTGSCPGEGCSETDGQRVPSTSVGSSSTSCSTVSSCCPFSTLWIPPLRGGGVEPIDSCAPRHLSETPTSDDRRGRANFVEFDHHAGDTPADSPGSSVVQVWARWLESSWEENAPLLSSAFPFEADLAALRSLSANHNDNDEAALEPSVSSSNPFVPLWMIARTIGRPVRQQVAIPLWRGFCGVLQCGLQAVVCGREAAHVDDNIHHHHQHSPIAALPSGPVVAEAAPRRSGLWCGSPFTVRHCCGAAAQTPLATAAAALSLIASNQSLSSRGRCCCDAALRAQAPSARWSFQLGCAVRAAAVQLAALLERLQTALVFIAPYVSLLKPILEPVLRLLHASLSQVWRRGAVPCVRVLWRRGVSPASRAGWRLTWQWSRFVCYFEYRWVLLPYLQYTSLIGQCVCLAVQSLLLCAGLYDLWRQQQQLQRQQHERAAAFGRRRRPVLHDTVQGVRGSEREGPPRQLSSLSTPVDATTRRWFRGWVWTALSRLTPWPFHLRQHEHGNPPPDGEGAPPRASASTGWSPVLQRLQAWQVTRTSRASDAVLQLGRGGQWMAFWERYGRALTTYLFSHLQYLALLLLLRVVLLLAGNAFFVVRWIPFFSKWIASVHYLYRFTLLFVFPWVSCRRAATVVLLIVDEHERLEAQTEEEEEGATTASSSSAARSSYYYGATRLLRRRLLEGLTRLVDPYGSERAQMLGTALSAVVRVLPRFAWWRAGPRPEADAESHVLVSGRRPSGRRASGLRRRIGVTPQGGATSPQHLEMDRRRGNDVWWFTTLLLLLLRVHGSVLVEALSENLLMLLKLMTLMALRGALSVVLVAVLLPSSTTSSTLTTTNSGSHLSTVAPVEDL